MSEFRTDRRLGQDLGDMSLRSASVLGAIGKFLITLGVLVLSFAAFQLWGTSFAESQAQAHLDEEFQQLRNAAQARAENQDPLPTTDTPEEPTVTDNPDGENSDGFASAKPIRLSAEELPAEGDAFGRIEIPAIGVDKTFVEGTTRESLREGPGHYSDTPLPGQPGNAAIAGHRTTHGAPFFDIDKLVPGDEIRVETLQGQFIYEVDAHVADDGTELGHFIVKPTDTHVIAPSETNRLTLTACHPTYSAAERIIVTATLVTEAAPTLLATDGPVPETKDPDLAYTDDASPDTDFSAAAVEASLGWQPEYANQVALWALITAFVGFGGWLMGRLWKRLPAYVLMTAPLLWALFNWFTILDKFLPAV